MVEIIKKRKDALIITLAELLLQKEELEKKIEAQKIAINEMNQLINIDISEEGNAGV